MSKFVFNELHTGDAAAAQKFYQGVFGWSFESVPMPNGAYIFIKSGDDGIGGIVQHDDGHPPHWLNYVGVDSVKRAINKAKRRGAEVIMGYTKVPNMGALAIMKDPTGAVFAVWEQAKKAPAAKKKATAKKKTTKKAVAKKAVAKKRSTKKAAAKKTAKRSTKKATAKKTTKRSTKKAAAKKTTRKAAAKKTTRKKAAAKKTTRKAAAKKTTRKKAAAKKTSRKRGAKKK